MRLCIFEDRHVEDLLPLVASRPVYDLRCGALTIAEKITRLFPRAERSLHVRDYLRDLVREEHAGIGVNEIPDGDTWLINGRVIADAELATFVRKNAGTKNVLTKNDEIVAAHIGSSELPSFPFPGTLFDSPDFHAFTPVPFSGVLVKYPWDLVGATPAGIENDFHALAPSKKIAGKIYPGVHILGKKNVLIGKGSDIRPGVVLDAENGPIIIGKNVMIMPNAVIIGPASIGDHSIIKIGAKIYHGSSIGPWCKVGGEVEASVIQSYSNKQHDGFLGHSYLGSWVNLGADTNTSDLKNTYGNVHVHVAGRLVDSQHQFVGLTMGDHSKTGINVMFDTGTVAGFSCNIYGAGLPPKLVPSFSWGDAGAFEQYDLEKSIATARKVMRRRNVDLSPAYERVMRSVFALTAGERKIAGVSG